MESHEKRVAEVACRPGLAHHRDREVAAVKIWADHAAQPFLDHAQLDKADQPLELIIVVGDPLNALSSGSMVSTGKVGQGVAMLHLRQYACQYVLQAKTNISASYCN